MINHMQTSKNQQQRGVSLLITFIVTIIMLAIILSVSTLLFSQVKVLGNMGSSVSAFYAAYSGVEKTLYFDRKQLIPPASRGLCTLCTACGPSGCQNCSNTPLAAGGCNPTQCDNCTVEYDSEFDGRTYSVTATVTPGEGSLIIRSQGYYRGVTRAVELTSN